MIHTNSSNDLDYTCIKMSLVVCILIILLVFDMWIIVTPLFLLLLDLLSLLDIFLFFFYHFLLGYRWLRPHFGENSFTMFDYVDPLKHH